MCVYAPCSAAPLANQPTNSLLRDPPLCNPVSSPCLHHRTRAPPVCLPPPLWYRAGAFQPPRQAQCMLSCVRVTSPLPIKRSPKQPEPTNPSLLPALPAVMLHQLQRANGSERVRMRLRRPPSIQPASTLHALPPCAAPVSLHHNLLSLPALSSKGPHKRRCEVLSCQQGVVENDAQLWQVVGRQGVTSLEALAQDAGLVCGERENRPREKGGEWEDAGGEGGG